MMLRRMMNDPRALNKIIDFFIKFIYDCHAYLLSLNDGYESSFSDKELHFLVIGVLGMFMMTVLYPIFNWLAKKHLTILITWFYVFCALLCGTLAIEIAQGYSHTGTMEFADIVFDMAGFLLFSFIYIISIALIATIKWIIRINKEKRRKVVEVTFDKKYINRTYKIKEIDSKTSAIEWLYNTKNIKNLKYNKFECYDLIYEKNCKNDSVFLDTNINLENLKNELKNRHVELLIINGKYYKENITVSVDLNKHTVCISCKKGTPVNLTKLEKSLKLA